MNSSMPWLVGGCRWPCGGPPPGTLYPVVGSDNEQGGYPLPATSLSRRCRHIAFLGDLEHPEAALRHHGYLRAMREAGCEVRDLWQRPIVFFGARIPGPS